MAWVQLACSKQVLKTLLVMAVTLRPCCAATAQGVQGTLKGGAGRDSASSQNARPVRVRPRLFFTPDKVERLRRRVQQDERFREAWLRIRDRADRQLTDKLVSREYAESGRGQHGNYGRPSSQIAGMASTLGLAYRMTGEQRYADKLKEALIHYTGLRRWAGDARRTPPWHSELNTARFCFGYAVGYDSIYDCLSQAERASIAKGHGDVPRSGDQSHDDNSLNGTHLAKERPFARDEQVRKAHDGHDSGARGAFG